MDTNQWIKFLWLFQALLWDWTVNRGQISSRPKTSYCSAHNLISNHEAESASVCTDCIVGQPNSPWQCKHAPSDALFNFSCGLLCCVDEFIQLITKKLETIRSSAMRTASGKLDVAQIPLKQNVEVMWITFIFYCRLHYMKIILLHVGPSVCNSKAPPPVKKKKIKKNPAVKADMFLQGKDLSDFTLTLLCLLNPPHWYLIFGAILGHSLLFAALGLL